MPATKPIVYEICPQLGPRKTTLRLPAGSGAVCACTSGKETQREFGEDVYHPTASTSRRATSASPGGSCGSSHLAARSSGAGCSRASNAPSPTSIAEAKKRHRGRGAGWCLLAPLPPAARFDSIATGGPERSLTACNAGIGQTQSQERRGRERGTDRGGTGLVRSLLPRRHEISPREWGRHIITASSTCG
eukprot:scaffold67421_cov33-Tisochrysis_lutea.AAC.8